MFKSLAEKKQQLDNFKKLQKSIDWVVVHCSWKLCEVYIDCSYTIQKINANPEFIKNWQYSLQDYFNDFLKTYNQAKQKATEILQTKSKEIFK